MTGGETGLFRLDCIEPSRLNFLCGFPGLCVARSPNHKATRYEIYQTTHGDTVNNSFSGGSLRRIRGGQQGHERREKGQALHPDDVPGFG